MVEPKRPEDDAKLVDTITDEILALLPAETRGSHEDGVYQFTCSIVERVARQARAVERTEVAAWAQARKESAGSP